MGDKKTVFRQDFASIYTAATTGKWFQYFGIELLPWPVFGLDLNLIENLQEILARKVYDRKKSPIENIV